MSAETKIKNRRKVLQGTVVSDKMDKTCVVQVKWAKKHKMYNKVVRTATKYKAHDEKNEAKIGDFVKIMETRPISKDKRWLVREIIQKAEVE
ncbi:MAG: 30S ribosomal protein S17 [Candidatus Omnitrophica bacterium]|nr:30S ribosomal protein S17 [Candidatus Omnitrophota bacterium]